MADPLDRALNGSQFGRIWGQGMDAVFPEGGSEVRPAPWKSAGRRKDRLEYDPDIVRSALAGQPELTDIDPRVLRATQPGVTRGGVDFYVNSPTYQETGQTYADHGTVSNKFPLVYRREDGQNLLLGGHHRGTAALVTGKSLQAIVVRGPWGPTREEMKRRADQGSSTP